MCNGCGSLEDVLGQSPVYFFTSVSIHDSGEMIIPLLPYRYVTFKQTSVLGMLWIDCGSYSM